MNGDTLVAVVSGEHEEFLSPDELAIMTGDVNYAEMPEDFALLEVRK